MPMFSSSGLGSRGWWRPGTWPSPAPRFWSSRPVTGWMGACSAPRRAAGRRSTSAASGLVRTTTGSRAAASRLSIEIVDAPLAGMSTLSMGSRTFPASGLVPGVSAAVKMDLCQAGFRFSRLVAQVPLEAPWRARRARAWDRRSAASWMHRNVVTAQGKEIARAMVEASFAFEAEETSLLGLLFDVGAARGLAELWQAQAGLFASGAQQIALRLAAQLDGRVLLGRAVTRIDHDSDGVVLGVGDETFRARRVAVCIPPALAARIAFEPALPWWRRRLVAGLPPGDAIKVIAVYDQPFWRHQGHSGQTLNTRSLLAVTSDSTTPGCSRGVLAGLAVASGAKRLRQVVASRREDRILLALEDLLGPRARDVEELQILDWSDEEWTGGCYAAHFLPGTWTAAGFALKEPCGRISWGGTETATDWHGYMEGAVRSGERVAAELLDLDGGAARSSGP